MAKRKQDSFLSRRKILSRQEYEDYKRLKSRLKEEEYKKEISGLRSKERKLSYTQSRTARVGGVIASGFSILGRKGGVTRALYGGSIVRKGTKGRPAGTVKYTDPRTGQPIGVYEYRKILSARLQRERAISLRNSAISPQQQEVLRRIELRKATQSMNPERRVIPDTSGTVYLNDIMGEIDTSANLVD